MEEETLRRSNSQDVILSGEVEGDKCHNRKRRGRNDASVYFCNCSLIGVMDFVIGDRKSVV